MTHFLLENIKCQNKMLKENDKNVTTTWFAGN